MKNKTKKTIIKILTIMVLIFSFAMITNKIYAGSFSSNKLDDIYKNPDTSLGTTGGKIIWMVQIICYSAAVIILIYKGVQFMKAAPEGKAEIKKQMIAYAIGALLLFAVGTFVKVIGNMALSNI